jgi:hypothetical protein
MYTNQTTSWLMHSWSTFGARTNHGQTQTHKTHHGLDLGQATTFHLIIYFVSGHGTGIQMALCPETPKWESQNSHNWDSCDFWRPITLHANLQLGWSLKKSCSPYQYLFNNMLHATYTWGNRGDSWLLMVMNQIANLNLSSSFGHNLHFRCPNGPSETISDI